MARRTVGDEQPWDLCEVPVRRAEDRSAAHQDTENDALRPIALHRQCGIDIAMPRACGTIGASHARADARLYRVAT